VITRGELRHLIAALDEDSVAERLEYARWLAADEDGDYVTLDELRRKIRIDR